MLLSHLYAFECVGVANARKPYTIRFNLSSRLIKSLFAWLKPTDVWAQCLPLTPMLHTEAWSFSTRPQKPGVPIQTCFWRKPSHAPQAFLFSSFNMIFPCWEFHETLHFRSRCQTQRVGPNCKTLTKLWASIDIYSKNLPPDINNSEPFYMDPNKFFASTLNVERTRLKTIQWITPNCKIEFQIKKNMLE